MIIEDSPSGIQAGKAAGAYAIGYKGAEVQQDTTGSDTLWKDYALFEENGKRYSENEELFERNPRGFQL